MNESELEEIRLGNASTNFKWTLCLRKQLAKMEEGISAAAH